MKKKREEESKEGREVGRKDEGVTICYASTQRAMAIDKN